MRAFVINLNKNVERLNSIDEELRRFGIAYERFPAVCGKSLSKADRRAHYSLFRALCIRGIGLRMGEIGCALSHVGVYWRMASENVPYALVLEDDVKLSDRFADTLSKAESFIDVRRPQVIVLSALVEDKARSFGFFRTGRALCADAYLITLPAARIIAARNHPIITVADAWSRWSRRYGVEIFQAHPSVARQDNAHLGTDVDSWGTYEEKQKQCPARRGVVQKTLWLIYRACGLSMDWLLWRMTGR